MATNESVQLVLRLIQEKHASLIASSNQLMRVLAGEDASSKKATAQSMLQIANDLRAILSSKDVPNWLSELINQLSHFANGQWQAADLLINHIPIKAALDAHAWAFDGSTETAFDFDSIFEHYKKSSRLPELFDLIIQMLTEIHDSGQIDSLSMMNALAKVVATLKKGRDGSYFSLNSAWGFLITFLDNYMWGELSKVPLLGTALDALRKTISETNLEMQKVHQGIQDEMVRTVSSEINALSDKASFSFVTYDKSAKLHPVPSGKLLSSLSTLDIGSTAIGYTAGTQPKRPT
jgi:hypothetical protein